MPARIPAIVIYAEWHPGRDHGDSWSIRPWVNAGMDVLMKSKRFKVTFLRGRDATREKVRETLDEMRGRKGLVVFYGHGCDCGEALLESGGNPPLRAALSSRDGLLLKGKVVYAVGCHCARGVGEALRDDVLCYLGYEDMLSCEREGGSGGCKEQAVNAGLAVLAAGGTCEEAWTAIRDGYSRQIVASARRDALLLALDLANSLDALAEPLGDAAASLWPAR